MNIQQLWYFLSAAEHQNFSKAAQDHYISQTAISQQILSLEQQLGFKLFYREHRAVQLTPQGQVFYDEIKVILVKLDQATKKARLTGSSYILSIGFVGLTEKTFLSDFIRNFRANNPNIELVFTQDTSEMIRQGMIDECLDIVFDLAYSTEPLDNISWKVIGQDRLCAVVYSGHPLSERKSLNLSELAGESFVSIEKKEAPYAFEAIQALCHKCGFIPEIKAQTKSPETILFLVESHIGIALLPYSAKSSTKNGTVFIPLAGEEYQLTAVIKWLRSNNNPAIKIFVKSLEVHNNSIIHQSQSSIP